MKHLYYVLIISVLCCETKNSKTESDPFQLYLKIDNTNITISDELAKIEIDTVIKKKSKKITRKLTLSKTEKRNILNLAEKALRKKGSIIRTNTCYAGQDFKIMLSNRNEILKLENESVESWTTIFSEFNEIHELIYKQYPIKK